MKRRIYQICLIVLYIGMIIFYSYQCLKNSVASSQTSDTVTKVVADVQEKITNKEVVVDDNYKYMVRKIIGHFGYFVLLGFVSILLWLSFNKIKHKVFPISIHYVLGFTFAFISEFVFEKSTDGRVASMKDVLINYSGFILLSTLFLIFYFVYMQHKKIKNA